MKPVLHRVLVKRDPIDEKTASGIIIAKDLKKEQKATVVGTVVSVGSTAFISFGSSAENEGIAPGVRVHYAKYAGAEIPDTELVLLNDEDILGVLEDE